MANLTPEQKREWILKNCIDERGNVDLSDLDFSNFDGDISVSHMKVKGSLSSSNQTIGETLLQHGQIVGGNLIQNKQTCKNLFQNNNVALDTYFLQSTKSLSKVNTDAYISKKYTFNNLTLEELKEERSTILKYRKPYQNPYKGKKGRKTYTLKNITIEELNQKITNIELKGE